MFKVLLVDDERIILEGISNIIDWPSHQLVLAGTARNGIEAFEFIQSQQPDIVISDIRMPGMDGIHLVEKAREAGFPAKFIMLSGFGEFDYAREAMRYGVKHYLLKPCNEQTIIQALSEVVEEWNREMSKEQFLQKIERELKKVVPHAKQQFLKEFVTNKAYNEKDWEDYHVLFGVPPENKPVRLLLFQLEGAYDYEHLFALTNIAQEVLEASRVLLSTTIGKQVLIMVEDVGEEELLFGLIEQIKSTYLRYYKIDVTIALSNASGISNARQMYRETLACLSHRFYLGEGSLITQKDIASSEEAAPSVKDFIYDEERLCMLIKSGHAEDAVREIKDLFDTLASIRLDTVVTKSYVIPLYMAIVRQGDPQRLNNYLKQLVHIEKMNTLQALADFISNTAIEIAAHHYELNKHKHSEMIEKVIAIIRSHLANPDLSLHAVANEMLYMNADYLGKLFKKEIGEKFSNYVMRLRMDKAIEIIGQTENVKVFELAEMLGFGDNPQYFSQVFKKYTGYTPSEFKRTPS